MNKKLSLYLTALVALFISVSCSSDDNSTGPGEDEKEVFNPTSIVIKKNKGAASSEEKWQDITFDKNGDIKSFEHIFVKNGVEMNRSIHTITGKTDNNEMIANIDVFDANGNKTKSMLEIAKLNEYGYITEIRTITTTSNEQSSPTLTTITRTFEYNGLTCRKFTYAGNDYEITCEYTWQGYKLTRTTERVVDLVTGKRETNVYQYTYDDNIYPYEGISMFPFVQSERDNNVIPHIYASSGYFGATVPYIVKSEKQERHTTVNNDMGPGFNDRVQYIEKFFDFNKKNSRGEVKYYIQSTDQTTNVDLYDNYTITFTE